MNNKYDQISEIIANFTQIYAKFAKEYGLSYNELHCFYYLTQNEYVTMSEISKLWSIPKQTLNSFRNKYVKKGYISVVADKADKRKKVIALTSAGKDFAFPMIERLTGAELSATKNISEKEFAAFKHGFNHLTDELLSNLN